MTRYLLALATLMTFGCQKAEQSADLNLANHLVASESPSAKRTNPIIPAQPLTTSELLKPPKLGFINSIYVSRDAEVLAAANFVADVGGVKNAQELISVIESIRAGMLKRELSTETEQEILTALDGMHRYPTLSVEE